MAAKVIGLASPSKILGTANFTKVCGVTIDSGAPAGPMFNPDGSTMLNPDSSPTQPPS